MDVRTANGEKRFQFPVERALFGVRHDFAGSSGTSLSRLKESTKENEMKKTNRESTEKVFCSKSVGVYTSTACKKMRRRKRNTEKRKGTWKNGIC